MVKLAKAFREFNPFKVLVIGDFMLDTYTMGSVSRISPEAPVSVLHVKKEEARAGGAGNVALNLQSLGGVVQVLGRVGADLSGKKLIKTLKSEGIDTAGLLIQEDYATPVKNRLIADGQQVLRVDHEEVTALPTALEEELALKFDDILSDISIIALSDYNKGFLTPSFLRKFLAAAKKKGVLVICDPKGSDFSKYANSFMIKPNLKEAYIASGMEGHEPLDKVANELFKKTNVEHLLITRSEKGISLFSKEGARKDFPVKTLEVIDVTGAGDTVLAMVAASLANNLELDVAAEFSNISASIAIEKLGCARVTLSDLAKRLLEINSESKIFDEAHLYALMEVLGETPFSILVLDSEKGLTSPIFRRISDLSKENELIIYLKDLKPDSEFIHILSSLSEVRFIILQKESLASLCSVIHPENIYYMEEREPKELGSLLNSLDRQLI